MVDLYVLCRQNIHVIHGSYGKVRLVQQYGGVMWCSERLWLKIKAHRSKHIWTRISALKKVFFPALEFTPTSHGSMEKGAPHHKLPCQSFFSLTLKFYNFHNYWNCFIEGLLMTSKITTSYPTWSNYSSPHFFSWVCSSEGRVNSVLPKVHLCQHGPGYFPYSPSASKLRSPEVEGMAKGAVAVYSRM